MAKSSLIALVWVVGLTGVGCGTRVDGRSGAEPVATARSAASGRFEAPPPSSESVENPALLAPTDSARLATPPADSAGTSGAVAAKTGPADAAGPDVGPPGSAAEDEDGPAVSPAATGDSGTAPVSPGATREPAPPAPSRSNSVVKVGSVGTHSGPVGGVLKGAIEALQVWQRAVNDSGGLDGHPVKILFVDDGGEPARHLAAMRDLVEREKVIAFVQDSAPIGNGRSSIPYIESKRIPVIGSETGSPWFYESPMYFPQAPSGYLAFYAGVASHARAVALGNKKLATIACAEVNACQDADDIYARYAPTKGFEHVYRARASVTQPDFTAECLAARNAGADFLVFAADTSSITRATRSCARQGYRPKVGLLMSMITDGQKNDPNLAGALGTSNIFPWFQSDTPATAEFQAAMMKYLPNGQLGIAHATAWTSAKLLEKAASSLSDPPTSDDILRVLWTMKNETLGGITRVSFTEGRPATKIVCWYDLGIKDSRWVSPDGFAQHCVDPPPGL